MLFRNYGWSKAIIHKPKYRKTNKRYNLDNYSSKGSTVKSHKKVHHMMLLQQDHEHEDGKLDDSTMDTLRFFGFVCV